MKEIPVTFTSHGKKIKGILHTPDKKTTKAVILAHGFTGNINGPDNVYVNLANQLAEEGFAALRFNFRFTNPDTWKGFEKMTIKGEVEDLKNAIGYLSTKFEKIGVVGESMGGAVAVLSYNQKVKCMVLWYPAIFLLETPSFREWKKRKNEIEKQGYLVIEKIKIGKLREIRIGKEFFKERETLKVINFVKKIRAPLLIVTGDNDNDVSHNQSELAFKLAKNPKKLELIHGADHCFRGEKREEWQNRAIELTVNWFNEWLK
ncbi:MAG: alpha/beta fold hydrolase [Candidatus Aenigmarchaeota archaeon]|nr:alpha/beta fold hydrolase [Candidatus Aenigmarchaeota archaeon]